MHAWIFWQKWRIIIHFRRCFWTPAQIVVHNIQPLLHNIQPETTSMAAVYLHHKHGSGSLFSTIFTVSAPKTRSGKPSRRWNSTVFTVNFLCKPTNGYFFFYREIKTVSSNCTKTAGKCWNPEPYMRLYAGILSYKGAA